MVTKYLRGKIYKIYNIKYKIYKQMLHKQYN